MDFVEYQEQSHETAVYPNMIDLVLTRLQKAGIITQLEMKVDIENQQVCESINSNPYYPALGLAGEVGEYCNKLKKVQRDNAGEVTEQFREFAKKEIGDILWYVSECASSLNLDLNEIAKSNIQKLKSRKERGVLKGSGDDR